MPTKFVLLLEGNQSFSDVLKITIEKLGNKKVIQVFDINKANAELDKYGANIVCAVFGEIGVGLTTVSLIEKMRGIGFKHLISFSGYLEIQEKQMQVGCTKKFSRMDGMEMCKFIKGLK